MATVYTPIEGLEREKIVVEFQDFTCKEPFSPVKFYLTVYLLPPPVVHTFGSSPLTCCNDIKTLHLLIDRQSWQANSLLDASGSP